MSLHTTARLTINERESELQRDMVEFLTRLAPAEGEYRHNHHTVDGRANAHAHLLGLFVNASETIPITDGALVLGAWQSIFFVELDGPRAEREVQLQVIGERDVRAT
jgi:secondary thiamine-phosphate synthase enzyme